jgi:4-hydroxythreonine-4-phosphate dehydrogenase
MKSLGHAEPYDFCRPLLIGDAGRLREAGQIVGSKLKINAIKNASNSESIT